MKQIRTYLVILAAIALLSIVIDLNEESFTSYTFDVLKFPRLTGASPFDQPAQISQISITNCTNISNSGDFVLTTDILNNDSARCIDIDAADVYLNCNNRTVDGIYNGTTYGIYLISTNVTVKDCNVTDWGIGIYLSDADNSFILDNRINNSNGTGISTGLADNNTLKNNLISNSPRFGFVISTSNNITFFNNTVKNTTVGVHSGGVSNYNKIIKNIFDSNNVAGVSFNTTNRNNTAENNTIFGSSIGIYLTQRAAVADSKNNIIKNNTIYDTTTGIHLENTVSQLYLENNLITLNNIQNTSSGIKITGTNTYNKIFTNSINLSADSGIKSIGARDIVIENNTISNSANTYYGINLETTLNENVSILNNTIYNCSSGILVSLGTNSTIEANEIHGSNQWGIWGSTFSSSNITDNTIYNSSGGIRLYGDFNYIYNNNITNITNIYASDLGSCNNYWNISKTLGPNIIGGTYKGGNFYSNYTGVDGDGDGIGETFYYIEGSCNSIDYLPLTNNKNSTLTIWDELDAGLPFAGLIKYVGDQIFFFANYSNATGPISGADCNITFNVTPAGPFTMSFNASKTIHEYNRSFTNGGVVDWNVTCNYTGHLTLTKTNDTIVLWNTSLDIWDETDPGRLYGDQSKNRTEQVLFFANYTNSTSTLNESTCNIYFGAAPTGPFTMTFNDTKYLHEYNRSFSTSGTIDWNVTCNQTFHVNRTDTDTVDINPTNNLTIWDELDFGRPYGGQSKYVDDQIFFFSNYTNLTNTLNESTCNISFNAAPTGPFTMFFNDTKYIHEYNRSFSSPSTYIWTVNCNQTGEETLNDTDTIQVFNFANLTIWDETDFGRPYGGQVRYTNELVYFFANYTNRTSTMNESTCNISFTAAPTGPFAMSFNDTKYVHEYSRTFSTGGAQGWSVICNKTTYPTINKADFASISTPPTIDGGGGGGRAPAPIFEEEEEIEEEEITFRSDGDISYDRGRNRINIDYSKFKQNIRYVEIDLAYVPDQDITITSDELSIEDAKRMLALDKELTTYLNIFTQGLSAGDISEVRIILQIFNDHLLDQRIDPQSITSIKLVGGQSEVLDVDYLYSDEVSSYYQVTTNDLSLITGFALAGDIVPRTTVNYIPVQISLIVLVFALVFGGWYIYSLRVEKPAEPIKPIKEFEEIEIIIPKDLELYVDTCIHNKIHPDDIKEKLKEHGWSPETIDYILRAKKYINNKKPNNKKNNKKSNNQ